MTTNDTPQRIIPDASDFESVTDEFLSISGERDLATELLVEHWETCVQCNTGKWCREGKRLLAKTGEGGQNERIRRVR